jgi:hypothetical protein
VTTAKKGCDTFTQSRDRPRGFNEVHDSHNKSSWYEGQFKERSSTSEPTSTTNLKLPTNKCSKAYNQGERTVESPF